MKKFLFLLLAILAILFVLSCPQELTKGTAWEGEIEGDFGDYADDDDNDFELIFSSDGSVKAYITVDDDTAIKLEGDYILTNNYTFTAELEGDTGSYDFELELEGTLNYYSGYGSGEYEMKISGGNPEDGTYDDDWELTKVGS
jgi:hypothetical protein